MNTCPGVKYSNVRSGRNIGRAVMSRFENQQRSKRIFII
jgi:hypothetical protein